jgi:type IV secretion system protein TrbE
MIHTEVRDRKKAQGLSDLLNAYALVDREGSILMQYDGSFCTTWEFRGPDMQSASDAELEARSAQLNTLLKLLGSNWLVQCDVVRSQVNEYLPLGIFPDPVTCSIEVERERQFTHKMTHFRSHYYLSLTYQPPTAAEEKVYGWCFENADHKSGPAAQAFTRFEAKVTEFERALSSLFTIERLRTKEINDDRGRRSVNTLLQFLRLCITGNDYPFVVPEIPVDLNDLLACEDFIGGIKPKIGRKHLRPVAIDGFPKVSIPGMLSFLDVFPMEYRWHTRAIPVDAYDARKMFENIRKRWNGVARRLSDQIKGPNVGRRDGFVDGVIIDIQQAEDEASGGDVQFALYNSGIFCMHEDEEQADENAAQVVKALRNAGFGGRLEDLNAVEAWRGSIPGDGFCNVRRIWVHTLNLADMLATTAPATGVKENPSPLMPSGSPATMVLVTNGATPFYWSPHAVDEVGHLTVIGPAGTGKSTIDAVLAASWMRYPGAQVFIFDRGRSCWALTKAVGGEFYDLAGRDSDLAFCPLSCLEDSSDVTWAVHWVEVLCALSGLTIRPAQRNALATAVEVVRRSPTPSMTEFVASVPDKNICEALEHYTVGHPLGSLLDANEDGFRSGSRWIAFETETLMGLDDKAVLPVILYLFRRIEKRLDGSPTLIILDEAWSYLKHPAFRDELDQWLRTMRKKNAVVVLSTQQVSDIANSGIADVVLNNCASTLLLANPQAKSPGTSEFYTRIGLNDHEKEMLVRARPKGDCYIVSRAGRRMVNFELGRFALAFAGANSNADKRMLARLMQEHPDTWREEWLCEKGLKDWADYLFNLRKTSADGRPYSA